MTSFSTFIKNCKTRHDFDDMIQVRYVHADGEEYDTWVSGKEALARIRSEASEARLKGIGRLDLDEIRAAGRRLPDDAKKRVGVELRNHLAEGVEDVLGENSIVDGLSAAIRGDVDDRGGDHTDTVERQAWLALLQDDGFRAKVLELAWINLEGSLPEGRSAEPDDWI
jgi:hypothetical protein